MTQGVMGSKVTFVTEVQGRSQGSWVRVINIPSSTQDFKIHFLMPSILTGFLKSGLIAYVLHYLQGWLFNVDS